METLAIIKADELSELLKCHHDEIKSCLYSSLPEVVISGFCNRFYNVFVSPDEVARMHSVHKTTVIEYIKDGTIEAKQEKKYGMYHIRLSDALRFDFKEMRKQLRRKQS
jgi:hypothetical protein